MNSPIGSSAAVPLPTRFAPAERATPGDVSRFAMVCLENPIIKVVLESIDGFVLILNPQRQVLAANPEVLADLEIVDDSALLGLRFGELFGCVHSRDEQGGCGTSKHCSSCGAAICTMASQIRNESITGECLMTIKHKGVIESREFRIRATPLALGNCKVTIFTIHDISAWKRLDLIENIFLHDALNIVTSLQNWSELLIGQLHDSEKAAAKIVQLSKRLTQEVQHQRLVRQAEKGELQPQQEVFSCIALFTDLRTMFDGYCTGRKSRFIATDPEEPLFLRTDYQLLSRIIINMIKNALEASEPDGIVRTWLELVEGQPRFAVHNSGVIANNAQLQIFQRSFSTKGGRGRGIGTYSMKLFGERYLGGNVSFTSTEADGTCFYFLLPKSTLVTETGQRIKCQK